MINNFELIQNLILRKSGVGEFYFLQILKRRKDNPDMVRDMNVIDNFFIKGADDLERKKDHIINICNNNNARAYLRLNKRSEKTVALQTLRLISENIASSNYNIKSCYTSCCGKYHSDENKTWVVDLDGVEQPSPLMLAFIDYECEPISKAPNKGKCLAIIPTKNGIHLITKPFRLDKFKLQYPKVDVHKDNPTMLYMP